MEPPYRLNRKEVRVADSVRVSYDLKFSQDAWNGTDVPPAPVFGSSSSSGSSGGLPVKPPYAKLAERAYLSAVVKETEGAVTHVPKHVAVIVTEPMRGTATTWQTFRVSNVHLDAARAQHKQWIYLVEPRAALATMACVGGMHINKVASAGRRTPVFTQFRTAQLNTLGFFDRITLEHEASQPELPSAVLTPQSSLLASGGIRSSASSGSGSESTSSFVDANAPSPLLDYAGKRMPRELHALCHMVTAEVPRAHLLEQRYEALQNVARFARLNDVADAAVHGTAQQRYEASTIALFQGMWTDAPQLQHCADVVSYWSMREHVLARTPRDGAVWKWFASKEMQLITLRTRIAHVGDERRLLAPVIKAYGLVEVEEEIEGEGVATLFSMDFSDAVEAGVALRFDAIAGSTEDGRILFTAEQVADLILPLWIARAVAGELEGCDTVTGAGGIEEISDNDAMEENSCGKLSSNSSSDDSAFGDIDALRAAADRLITDRQEAISRGREGLHLPTAIPTGSPLPDIEDLAGAGRALHPPCAFALAEKLHRTGHLKFPERNAYTSFLLDINYDPAAVEAHLRKHFTTTGRTSAGEFQNKYAGAVYRSEAGKWEDGFRSIPYGMSCTRLIPRRNIAGDSRSDRTLVTGCPFERMGDRNALAGLLQRMGIDERSDVEEIVHIARSDHNYARACATTFASKFGGAPRGNGAWRPVAPRAYYQEGKRIFEEMLDDDDDDDDDKME